MEKNQSKIMYDKIGWVNEFIIQKAVQCVSTT